MTFPPSRKKIKEKTVLGPQADAAFTGIAAPEIRNRVRLARIVYRLRNVAQTWLGVPLGNLFLKIWLHNWPGARLIEKEGLPRHNLSTLLGEENLTLHLNPRELIQFAETAPKDGPKRPPSMAFIWDGDWDLRRTDLRGDYWIAHMQDLDNNRHNLERTQKYQSLMADLNAGKPFRSHQEGVYLDSPERIIAYLSVYLGFLDNMAEHGYDPSRAKDGLGVVISREGRILKINRGLHRLAMAQWLGLPTIPVHVKHVHRLWWERITQGATGEQALQRMQAALLECRPESELGPLSEYPPVEVTADFWPKPRYSPTSGGDRKLT